MTFVVGVSVGALAVVVIQSFDTPNERASREVNRDKLSHSTAKSIDADAIEEIVEVRQFQDVFKLSSAFEQNRALYSILSSASERDLKAWWVHSQSITRDSHRKTAQNAILRRLTTTNPHEAVRYIEDVSMFQANALLVGVFSEWSISQLDEAIKAASVLPVRQRSVALQAILEARDDLALSERLEIAKKLEGEQHFLKLVSDINASQSLAKPEESWDILLNDDVDDFLQIESLALVAEAWREQIGFEVISKIFSATIDHQSKTHLLSEIVQIDPAGAFDYTQSIPDEKTKLSLSRVVAREWTSTDAKAALVAVSSIQPRSLALNLEELVANSWAFFDPGGAIDNIALISEEFREFSLRMAFGHISSQDPAQAIAKVDLVADYIASTSTIVENILAIWSQHAPADAVDWLVNNYTEDDAHRRKLLERVLPYLAREDPNQAFEVAIQQPAPSNGPGLEHVVIREIASKVNIEDAKKLLPRVNESSKAFSYYWVGEAMVRDAQTIEALELGKALAEGQQTEYYRQILRVWASDNPKNLYQSLEDLPSRGTKSRAAFQLILSNLINPVLTDEQIQHARTLLNSDDAADLERIERR